MEGRSSNGRLKRTAAVFAYWIAACAVFAYPGAAMGQTPAARPSPASPSATVGMYLTAIPGVNISQDSYVADFYLWSRSPANAPAPLTKVVIVRAKTQTILYEWSEKFGDQIWFLRKYRCEFLNDWELGSFPFDKHILAIAVVPNPDEYPSTKYEVDEKNSGMAKEIAPHGWATANFKIFSQTVEYKSSFGDPGSNGPYLFNAVTANFLLIRRPWRIFFKLMSGAYLAALAALIACNMKTEHPPIFAGRMGLQIGCLFAAIVNHREMSGATGLKAAFLLPDTLQILTYILIFTSLLLTLRSRSLNERNQQARALKEERRISLGLALLFVILNAAFVWAAIATPPSHNMLRLIQIGD